MEGLFRKGEFTEGVVHGVERVGEVLARHFPRARGRPERAPEQDRRGVKNGA